VFPRRSDSSTRAGTPRNRNVYSSEAFGAPPWGCRCHALNVRHDAGKPILVIGAGGVGLMGVRFAKSVLGREPIVAGIDENKRKLALENGACAALDRATRNRASRSWT
jgi:threonine dehydrogenase-like Zn-dependent dehydrogenase